MRASEILRDLADQLLLDKIARLEQGSTAPSNELSAAPDDVMIPPLQLKLELLKKATGVENVYADEENKEPEKEQHSYPDPLTAIKKNAGIAPAPASPVVLDALGDDEPLDV